MDQPAVTVRESTATRFPAWVHGFAWGALVVITLALVGVSRAGHDRQVWEGWRASSELRRPAYAEQIYINDVFRTRANTWSNLAYVLLGFYGLALAWHDARQRHPDSAGYLVQTPALSLAFGLACCYLGVGSGLFHASLTRFGQHLDVAAMYAPLLVLIAVGIGRRRPRLTLGSRHRNFPTWPILIVIIGVASFLLFIYKWSMSSRNVLTTLIATIALLAVSDQFRASRKLGVCWLFPSGVALIAAVICRQLDVAGRFTAPEAWLQGHALWHLFTSLSLGGMYLYYRSELTASTDHSLQVNHQAFLSHP